MLRLGLAPDCEIPAPELLKRIKECALRNTPALVRGVLIRDDGMGLAHLDPALPDFGVLEAPRPITRRGLYVYLHECAHFALHTDAEQKSSTHLREYEAERFAIGAMKRAGIRIPPEEVWLARQNVARAIEIDRGG